MAKMRHYQSPKEIADIQALGPDEVRRRLKGAVEHSQEEIAEFQRLVAAKPEYARQLQEVVAYAKEQGGLTLDFWQRFNGPAFGQPWIMTLAACAEELNVPVATLDKIMGDTFRAVRERLEQENHSS